MRRAANPQGGLAAARFNGDGGEDVVGEGREAVEAVVADRPQEAAHRGGGVEADVQSAAVRPCHG